MPSLRLIPAIAVALILGTSACSEPTAALPPETFTGTWRSVTKSYEHLRLTVAKNPILNGVLDVRLSFSGVQWVGPGRIEADSMIMDITTSSMLGTLVVAHPAEQGSLRVRAHTDTMTSPLLLSFVRDE